MKSETMESLVVVPVTYPTLCRQVLADQWPRLALPVRLVHEIRPATLIGCASVVRGSGSLARLLGWIGGLPPEQRDGPVRVVLEQSLAGRRERWTRHFGGARPLCSSLRRVGSCIEETVGPTCLRFQYAVEGGSIRWRAVAGRTFGITWPRSWLDGIDAFETTRGGRYYFNVRAALPYIGLVVHYVGVLELVTV